MFNQREGIIHLDENLNEDEPYVNLNPINNPNSKYLKDTFNPVKEYFADFIIANFEKTINIKKNNLIAQWFNEFFEWRSKKFEIDDIGLIEENIQISSKKLTGNVESLLQLAFDVYCLQITGIFPNFLKKRLELIEQFQGAKYEISVASIMLRAGFIINFDESAVKNQSGKSCEFIATHRITKDKIGIEAKSKKFLGVLNSSDGKDIKEIKDNFLGGLLREAKEQRPAQLPFIIFLDSNTPPSENLHLGDISYFNELSALINGDHDKYINANKVTPYNYVIVTNFSDHYFGNDFVPGKASFCALTSKNPTYRFNDDNKVYSDLIDSLNNYTKGINKITRKIARGEFQ